MGLALDEPKDDDDQLTVNEVPVLIAQSERDYLVDSVVDFEKNTWGEGFSVRSAASSTC